MDQQDKSIQFNHHIPFGGDTNYNTKWQGTAAWMAPEVTGNNYGFKADVYSFGIVMYELLTCRIPWKGSGYNFTHQIAQAVLRGERPEITESDLVDAPEDFIALMNECWETNPKARPTFQTIEKKLSRLFLIALEKYRSGLYETKRNGKNGRYLEEERDAKDIVAKEDVAIRIARRKEQQRLEATEAAAEDERLT
jgi:serine/threonine protein kinase